MLVAFVFLTALSLLPFACAQCPAVCACIGLTNTMDCTPRAGIDFRFTVIPPDGPVTTRTIIMTGNLLSTLLSGNFSAYPSLQRLVLDNNLLTEIPEGGLDSLPQLTSLSLDGNPLTTLGEGVFRNLTSLEELSIRQTPLTTINGSAFEGLTSLLRLLVDSNQISELPTDLLVSVPQLEFLSVTLNSLQTLPEGIFDPLNPSVAQLNLTANPWSCDCFLRWMREFLDLSPDILPSVVVCLWPPQHTNQPIISVPANEFQCYPPSVVQQPQDADILTDRTFTLVCDVDGAPYPEVTWTKDEEVLDFTERVYLDLYNGSLQFADVRLEDVGVYQCFASNINGSTESSNATLSIAESTCFDEEFTSRHETDVDCGGEFCLPCNISQNCLADRDCVGELVCLYAHQLPSTLLYISPFDPLAYTCAEPSVPSTLLEASIQEALPTDIFSVNFTGIANASDLQSTFHDLLAEQLQVPRPTISSVQVSTVSRMSRPLYQVWFSLQKSQPGEQARATLLQQIDDGTLKATIRITEETSSYRVRMNL